MTDKPTKKNSIKNSDTFHPMKRLNAHGDQREFFIETIAKFCDKCGNAYNVNDVNLVQDSNFSSIIHFSCPNCKSNHIATFVKPVGMSSRVPVNTDLAVDEIAAFAKRDKVTPDEVLDLYEYLDESRELKKF